MFGSGGTYTGVVRTYTLEIYISHNKCQTGPNALLCIKYNNLGFSMLLGLTLGTGGGRSDPLGLGPTGE